MRQFQPGVPEFSDWALEHLKGKCVGVDPRFISAETSEDWTSKWGSSVQLKEIGTNLVDAIWTTRPEDPCNAVQVHPLNLAGETIESKLKRLREAISAEGASVILLSALDQIAWLFNLRGSDIEYNPVFFAYAAVFQDTAILFLRCLDATDGLPDEVLHHLKGANVEVKPYKQFFTEIATLLKPEEKVFLDPSSSSLALMSLVRHDLRVTGISPVEKFKACKNSVEIEALKQACKRDSLALCELFASLEAKLSLSESEQVPITEVDVGDMMKELRQREPFYVGDSFQTISSVGSNSAVVHYQPERDTCKSLSKMVMYLIDTGGHYKDGTTDVTRTMHFGCPTQEQKRIYTRVLQGHIALASAVFPEGTPGLLLDAFARGPLWKDGLEYGHGTGHGIGAYLNVHEGPAQIGGGCVPGDRIQENPRRRRLFLMPIQAGFFLSDEPGCYKDGEFGVRIESDILTCKAETPYKMSTRRFLKFEYLTLVPMCRKLVDVSLLSVSEQQWIDSYHARVWEELRSSLHSEAQNWLWEATRPLKAE